MQKVELRHTSTFGAHKERCCLCRLKGGRVMLAAGSAAVLDLDLNTGDTITTFLRYSTKAIGCIAYSKAARCTSVGEHGFKPSIYVFFDDQGPQQAPLKLKGHNFGIAALAWSPQGSLLASAGVEKDRQLHIWSPISGAILGRSRLDEDYHCLEFVDDKTLCGINGEHMAIWTLGKTVSVNRNTQYKLARKLYRLELPASCSSGKSPPRVTNLCTVQATPNSSGKRLWAGFDSGYVLQFKINGKCEKLLDLQDGRIMQMSMSTHYIACAMASGVVQVLNISSPEQVIALTCPDTAVNLAAVSCVFSSDGSQLAALFSNGRLCAWDCTLLDQKEPATAVTFHSSPIVDAAIVQLNTCAFVASCSQDGKVQLSPLKHGQLLLSATADLRQQQELRGVRLSSMAVSSDGLLLATGDSIGSIHLLTVYGTTPKYFKSIVVHEAEITCAAFAPSLGQGKFCSQYLAVGARSGELKVLECKGRDLALVQLQESPGPPVVSIKWVHHGALLQLLAARRDGKLEVYTVHTSPVGVHSCAYLENFHTGFPRGPIVGLETYVFGQVAAVCSKSGSLSLLDAISGDSLVSLHTEKNAGDVTSFAFDEGICIAAVATSKNVLQVYDRGSGKLLASSRVHLAGTSITKVLISPCSSTIITVGEDASIRAWEVPDGLKSVCLSEQQRLGAAVQLMSEAKSGVSSATEHSALYPTNLFNQHFQETDQGTKGSRDEEVKSHSAEAAAFSQQDVADAALLCPNENATIHTFAEQFSQLEEQLKVLKYSPRHRCVPQGRTAATGPSLVANKMSKSAAAPSTAPTCTTALATTFFGDGHTRPTSPVAAAVRRSAAGNSRKDLPRSSSFKPGQPWRSPREGSGLWVPLGDGGLVAVPESVQCQALHHVSTSHEAGGASSDPQPGLLASREHNVSSDEHQCAETASPAESRPEVPIVAAGTAICDHDTAAKVDRPKSAASALGQRRRRACWSFVKDSAGCAASLRHPLSSLESISKGDSLTKDASTCKPALGSESSPANSEEFVIWPDPSTPAVVFGSAVSQEVSGGAGSQDTEQGSQTSGGTSRRLTFSFGMAAPPQQGTKSDEEGGTPSFIGKVKQECTGHSIPPSVVRPADAEVARAPTLNVDHHAARPDAGAAVSVNRPSGCCKEQPAQAGICKSGQSQLLEVSRTGDTHMAKSTLADQELPQDSMAAASPQAAGGLRGRPPVPRLSLPRSQPGSPVTAIPDDKELSLREQYSARSPQASPLQAAPHPLRKSRLSAVGEGAVSGITGYATPSASIGSEGVFSETSESGEADADLFSSPHSSYAGPSHPDRPASAASIFSPPRMQNNQLYEGVGSSAPQDSVQAYKVDVHFGGGIGREGDQTKLPKQGSGTVDQQTDSAGRNTAHTASSEHDPCVPGGHRITHSEGSGSACATDASGWSKPPSYDPLELASESWGSKALGAKRRRQGAPPVDCKVENGLYAASHESESTHPFTIYDCGSFGVVMAKNAAFSPCPYASLVLNGGAANIRRMSTCVNSSAASALGNAHVLSHNPSTHLAAARAEIMRYSSPPVKAESGTPAQEQAPHTASSSAGIRKGRLSCAAVLEDFERALESFRDLQRAGLADAEFMKGLGEIGIELRMSLDCADTEPVRLVQNCFPSSLDEGKPETDIAVKKEMAALKEELLHELRKDIAAGALKTYGQG